MGEGFLLVVSGPSASGKGTICNEVLNRNEEIIFSISATTRKPRPGEKDGINYFFIDENQFHKMIKEDEFLEYAKVHNNFYGTPKKLVLDKIKKGKIVLLEIDVQGALQVKKAYPEAILIFLLPPSMEELKNRLIKRGTETKEDIDIRLKNALLELKYIDEYDYMVINDEIPEAIEQVEAIILAEKLKTIRNKIIF